MAAVILCGGFDLVVFLLKVEGRGGLYILDEVDDRGRWCV